MEISEGYSEGVSAILRRKGKTVLQLRDNNPAVRGAGLWGFFAGGLEPGETPIEAVVREVREELGIEIPKSGFQHFMTLELSRIRERHHIYVSRFEFSDTEITLQEGQAYRDFSDNEIYLLDNVVPGVKEVVRLWELYSIS